MQTPGTRGGVSRRGVTGTLLSRTPPLPQLHAGGPEGCQALGSQPKTRRTRPLPLRPRRLLGLQEERGRPGLVPGGRLALRTWPAPLRLTNSRGGTRPPARACASCLGARCWCSALCGEFTATVEAGQAFGRGLWSRPALEDEDVPRPGIPPCDSGRDGSLRGASVRSPVKQTHQGGNIAPVTWGLGQGVTEAGLSQVPGASGCWWPPSTQAALGGDM